MCTADRKIFNPSINASNDNRIDTTNGYTFDSSGNTTKDAQSRKFTYDAENKQIKVETLDINGNVTGTLGEYFYDGDGKRVKKVVPGTGETTIFVYDASGKQVAEYSTIVETTDPKVSYLTTDHLGSPRINTDQNGAVTARHDYQPFGEEIARTSYGSDEIRKQFTSYERDKETDLDFAQARMYANKLGRFTTTDPILMDSSRKYNPQEINLYIYVKNNPLSSIDPLGEKVEASGDSLKYYNDYKKFVMDLPDNNPDKAALLATLKQLEESEVTYVINVTSKISGAGDHTEGRVEPDEKGDKIMINIRNLGNNKENWSLNSRIGHELEHARQFDAGEIGFSRKKDGTWFVDGVDTEDEVKAYKVSVAIAKMNNLDSNNKNLKRIISGFQEAGADKEKQLKVVAQYLGKDGDEVVRQTNVPTADDEKRGLVKRPSKDFPVQRIWCNGGCLKRPIF